MLVEPRKSRINPWFCRDLQGVRQTATISPCSGTSCESGRLSPLGRSKAIEVWQRSDTFHVACGFASADTGPRDIDVRTTIEDTGHRWPMYLATAATIRKAICEIVCSFFANVLRGRR